MLACARIVHKDLSPSTSAIHVKSIGGLQSRFVIDYCRGCMEPPCSETCNTGAITPRDGGGIVFHREKCIDCKKCMDACSIGAIKYDAACNIPIICIQCGMCAHYCPHGILTMEERYE